jgi:hypothetical protein
MKMAHFVEFELGVLLTQPPRIILFEDEGMIVAQCLDFDVCAQGKDVEIAMDRIRDTLHVEHEYMGGLERLPPAPGKYWDLFIAAFKESDRGAGDD